MTAAPPFRQLTGPGLNRRQRLLLSRVSRSFDLSIRLLPKALQAPVAIGYLLARATDTVADTSALPLAERQALLDCMKQAIHTPRDSSAQNLHPQIHGLTQAFAAQQSHPHERTLMLALPECLALLHTLSEADQASVRTVLGHITRGQQQDMTLFGPGPEQLVALPTEADLDHYTWLVAGCVGEFWTELCGRHLPGYALLSQDEMLRIGREYGMGLQRLNIIRDMGADLADGRCYWPQETLAQAGLTPEWLAQASKTKMDRKKLETLSPLYTQWLDHTQAQLASGMRYALALQPWRLRLASALPALIGARTVSLLRQAGPAALSQRVKMPRHEVRALLWRLALGWGSRKALDQQFRQLSGDGPA